MKDITLTGTIIRTHLNYTPEGFPIATLTLAGAEYVATPGPGVSEKSFYQQVTFKGDTAVRHAEHKEGTPLFIKGVLKHETWENDAGERRSAVRVLGLFALTLEGVKTFTHKGQTLLDDARNEVWLRGNLTKDANTKQVGVSELRVAVNESWQDAEGKTREEAHYFNLEAWDETGQDAAELTKGTPVLVRGRLETRSWGKVGSKQYREVIRALSVHKVNYQKG